MLCRVRGEECNESRLNLQRHESEQYDTAAPWKAPSIYPGESRSPGSALTGKTALFAKRQTANQTGRPVRSWGQKPKIATDVAAGPHEHDAVDGIKRLQMQEGSQSLGWFSGESATTPPSVQQEESMKFEEADTRSSDFLAPHRQAQVVVAVYSVCRSVPRMLQKAGKTRWFTSGLAACVMVVFAHAADRGSTVLQRVGLNQLLSSTLDSEGAWIHNDCKVFTIIIFIHSQTPVHSIAWFASFLFVRNTYPVAN